MKLVCAWCGVSIDRPGYGQTLDLNTSHGMCLACSEAIVSQERGVPLQHLLDGIPIPILLIDSNDAVVTMNARACETLGHKFDTDVTRSLGPVFDCVHSRMPEGCGRTIHCSGCVIRRSAVTTFETGGPQILVPATLSVENPDGISDALLSITTVKGDGVVFLRIEGNPESARA